MARTFIPTLSHHSVAVLFSMGLSLLLLQCGSSEKNGAAGSGGDDTGSSGGSGSGVSGGSANPPGSVGSGGSVSLGGDGQPPMTETPTGPCKNLQCQQTSCKMGSCKVPACAAGQVTSVSGTVFDPAGKVPLYNVVVWVPNGPVPALKSGSSCDRCDANVSNPVVSTLTDTKGNFKLNDVPVGSKIPLVIQVGKWRRQVEIDTVAACTDTALMDKNLTRLPRNRMEGDIPRIAITTGGADSMECLPRRMGLDDAEFTPGSGEGRIHLYSGPVRAGGGGGMAGGTNSATAAFAPTLNAGAALTPASQLWSTKETLAPYDIVIMSCEGGTNEQTKPMAARQALYDYASAGGRVFASHWHHVWFSAGPVPVPTVGTWGDREDPQDPAVGTINTSFPKGASFSDWLVNVGASTTPGQLPLSEARDNLRQVNTMLATEWITLPTNEKCAEGCQGGGGRNMGNMEACLQGCMTAPSATQYISFNTPLTVPEAEKCGRVVFTDLHVSATGAEVNKSGAPFPQGCEMRDLTAQEKAVEFMLFDLSSCIQDDKEPPKPPEVVQ